MNVHGVPTEGGFTIIELIIVLAITGLLLTATVISLAGSQRYPQFTTDIDKLQIAAEGIQNEASATISTLNHGGQSDYEIFGKAMLFNPSSSIDAATGQPYNTEYTVATLLEKIPAPGDSATKYLLYECDDKPTVLPGSIVFNPFGNNPKAIVFANGRAWGVGGAASPGFGYTAYAGQLNTSVCTNPGTAVAGTPASLSTGPTDITDASNYSQSNAQFSGVEIKFNDPSIGNTHYGILHADTNQNKIFRTFNY